MGQRAITIYTPDSAAPHISAEDDAFIYRVLFGADSGILGALTCVKVDDNTVRLSGGGAMNRGHILRIPDGETLELAVANGAAGYKRRDSVVAEFVRGGGEDADVYTLKIVRGTAVTGTPSAPSLTTSNLLNKGNVNQAELFRLTLDGTTLTGITQIAARFSGGVSGGGSGDSASPSSPSSDSSPSSGGGKSFSGVVVSKVSSTVSSPTVNYSLSHSTARSGKITMSLTFAAWLNSSGSKLGTGVKLTVYARIGGGSWQSVTLKPASASWSGTARHTAQLTLTASDAGSAKVEFYVTRSGSTYAGTAGNLGSASSPKSYTVKLT